LTELSESSPLHVSAPLPRAPDLFFDADIPRLEEVIDVAGDGRDDPEIVKAKEDLGESSTATLFHVV
jgi:hypothetical protein